MRLALLSKANEQGASWRRPRVLSRSGNLFVRCSVARQPRPRPSQGHPLLQPVHRDADAGDVAAIIHRPQLLATRRSCPLQRLSRSHRSQHFDPGEPSPIEPPHRRGPTGAGGSERLQLHRRALLSSRRARRRGTCSASGSHSVRSRTSGASTTSAHQLRRARRGVGSPRLRQEPGGQRRGGGVPPPRAPWR